MTLSSIYFQELILSYILKSSPCSSFQGVVDGVTGIVLRPVEGAKQEGVEGFFKGKGHISVRVNYFLRRTSG